MAEERGFPGSLETARLALRRYCPPDSIDLSRLVDENRAQLLESFPPIAKGLLSADDATAFIHVKTAEWNERKTYCYGIWRQDPKALIGQIQVKNIVWDVPSAELSYFVASSSQRNGFAVEAIRAIVRLAFEVLSFRRIFVRVVASNKVSISLAKKLGFEHEGTHQGEFRCGYGKLHDVHYFSLIPESASVAIRERSRADEAAP